MLGAILGNPQITILLMLILLPVFFQSIMVRDVIEAYSVSADLSASEEAAFSLKTCFNLLCVVRSNSTVTDPYIVTEGDEELFFTASGTPGLVGFVNVTMNQSLVGIRPPPVFLNQTELSSSTLTISANSTHYAVYFTFTLHSSLSIRIILEYLPHPPPFGILVLVTLAGLGLLAVFISWRRKAKKLPNVS